MYSDLSIIPSSSIDLRHLLNRLPEQSYHSIALDFQIKGILSQPSQKQLEIIKIAKQSKLKVFTRSTLVVEQSPHLHQLSQTQKRYDILAVKPTNEKMFHTLCTQYDNYDVICFDMAVKMPFMLKRNPVYDALRKGKYFQIQYDAMFDQNTRVVCMTNMINIFKATKGKNLIISSHSSSFYRHRTPYDVASLMITLGMNKNQVLVCMKENAQNVIKASIHRGFFKGSIKEITLEDVKKLGKKISKHRDNFKKLKEKQIKLKQNRQNKIESGKNQENKIEEEK